MSAGFADKFTMVPSRHLYVFCSPAMEIYAGFVTFGQSRLEEGKSFQMRMLSMAWKVSD